ncbi:unnamed protein product [Darwinula stevensoni]|uniref:CCHC-type domain-containing protein n=1 Tax=Darwinula stevensoni TaxID=69355 RepID=A0A7R9ABB4_9CRUS|nr:unnamed protein product [Darwinula stevensoni]CAG0898759.1 unnamed protein product [Darwinula stevensoni]
MEREGSSYHTQRFESREPGKEDFRLRSLVTEKTLDAEQYVAMIRDIIKLQKNLCLCRHFYNFDTSRILKSRQMWYIDVWPINMFFPSDDDSKDTTSLFMLQLACILNMALAMPAKRRLRKRGPSSNAPSVSSDLSPRSRRQPSPAASLHPPPASRTSSGTHSPSPPPLTPQNSAARNNVNLAPYLPSSHSATPPSSPTKSSLSSNAPRESPLPNATAASLIPNGSESTKAYYFQNPVFIQGLTPKLQQKIAFIRSFSAFFPTVRLLNIRATRSAGFVLSLEKASDIPRICSRWSESGIGGEAFPAKSRLPLLKFIIKGVGLEEDLETVRDVLATEHGISLHEGGLIRMRKTKTGAPLPMVLVKALDTDTARALLKAGVLVIGCLRLKVEEFVLQPRIIQCFKCLEYGHYIGQCKSDRDVCSFCAGKGHSQKNCQARLNGLQPKCSHCQGAHMANSAACPKRQEKRRQVASDPRFSNSLLAKKIQEELKQQTSLGAYSRPALNYPNPPPVRTPVKLVPAPPPSRPAWTTPPARQVALAPVAPASRQLVTAAPTPVASPSRPPAASAQASAAIRVAPVAGAAPAVIAIEPASAHAAHASPERDAVIQLLLQQVQSIIAALHAYGFSLSLPAPSPTVLPSSTN